MDRLTVILKETGKLISVLPQQYDGSIHEKLGVKPKKEVADKQATEVVAEAQDRFAELKAKGWVKLNKEEKAEYKALKEL